MNCSVAIDVVTKGSNNIEVVFDAPKVAILVGTTAGLQLPAVLKLPEPGLSTQVASCAYADVAASNAAPATVLNKCVRQGRADPVETGTQADRESPLCAPTKRSPAHLPQKAVANWAAHQPLVEI